MSLFENSLDKFLEDLIEVINPLSLEEKVEALNKVKVKLHEISPFKNEPVDCVIWVPADTVQGNDYNPNKVAPPEMRLLKRSIEMNGFTQPIVVCPDKREDRDYTICDGFHRNKVGKQKSIRKRLHGYLPTAPLNEDRRDLASRIAATDQHNKARGVHGAQPTKDNVEKLVKLGWNDSRICEELGMDADELIRYKQALGLPDLFKDRDYSKSWE